MKIAEPNNKAVLGIFSGGSANKSREIFLYNLRRLLSRVEKIVPQLNFTQEFFTEFPETEDKDDYTRQFERNFQYISSTFLGAIRSADEEVITLFSFQTKVNRYCSLILTQKGVVHLVEKHSTPMEGSTFFRWSKILSVSSTDSYIPPSSDLAQFGQLFYEDSIYAEDAILKSDDFIAHIFVARLAEVKLTRRPKKS